MKYFLVILVLVSLTLLSGYAQAQLTCSVTSGTCSGVDVFHIYSTTNSHAEMPIETNYDYKICCEGVENLGNSCSGTKGIDYDVVLRLSGTTNAHVEQNTKATPSYDGNDVCLSVDVGATEVVCAYSDSCSTLGPDYVCLASISADTNAHVGDCNAYGIKVCCKAIGDTTPPSYTWNLPSVDSWYKDGNPITIDVSVTDDGAGINDGEYCNPKMDGSTTSFTESVSVTYSSSTGKCEGTLVLNNPSNLADGAHQLSVEVSDSVGNSQVSPNRQIQIDNSAPTTTDTADTEPHSNGYEVVLTCSDSGSGCTDTYYCVYDNGGTQCAPDTIGNSVTISCDLGVYTCEKIIRYYSLDNVGNQEGIKESGVISIDNTLPSCSLNPPLPEYSISSSFTVSWSGYSPSVDDPITGYILKYEVGDSGWQIYGEYDTIEESYQIEFSATEDNSYSFKCQTKTNNHPNDGAVSTPNITLVDTTPPTVTMGSLPEWINTTSFEVSWSAIESGSGIASYDVEYSIDDGATWVMWLSSTTLESDVFGPTSPVEVVNGGTYSFRAKAVDNAGNEGAVSEVVSTMVDTTPPDCVILGVDPVTTSLPLTVSWSGTDTGSGVSGYSVEISNRLDMSVWDDISVICTINIDGVSADCDNLNEGDTYHFRCSAVDNAGNEGVVSEAVSTTIDTNPPSIVATYEEVIKLDSHMLFTAIITDSSGIKEVTLMLGTTVLDPIENATSENTWELSWNITGTSLGEKSLELTVMDNNDNSEVVGFNFSVVVCLDGETRSCGSDVGECVSGTETCVNYEWNGECQGMIGEQDEVCDGKDNDCDGEVDNGINCACIPGDTQECGSDIGECQKGIQTCLDSAVWGTCEGSIGAAPEVCNGLDDDCNGQPDDNSNCCVSMTTRPCGPDTEIGECQTGTQQCVNGVWGGGCNGAVYPTTETCDGKDNDCDGEVDEIGCITCNNDGVCDPGEGSDCIDCPAPGEDPTWLYLIITGVVILVILGALMMYFRSKGEELTWEAVRAKWA